MSNITNQCNRESQMHLRTVLPQYSMQFKSLATKTENRKTTQVHNSTNCTSKRSMLYDLHLPIPPTPSLRAVSLAPPGHEILCHCCTVIVYPLGLAAVRLSTSARQTPSSPLPRRLGAKRRGAAWGLFSEILAKFAKFVKKISKNFSNF